MISREDFKFPMYGVACLPRDDARDDAKDDVKDDFKEGGWVSRVFLRNYLSVNMIDPAVVLNLCLLVGVEHASLHKMLIVNILPIVLCLTLTLKRGLSTQVFVTG